MATYALITPSRTGTVGAGAAVGATDKIPKALLGSRGVTLEIINGNASPDVVAISDASVTRTGAAATAGGGTVANGTSKFFKILPQQADPVTKEVTITHTVTSTVTYKMTAL